MPSLPALDFKRLALFQHFTHVRNSDLLFGRELQASGVSVCMYAAMHLATRISDHHIRENHGRKQKRGMV